MRKTCTLFLTKERRRLKQQQRWSGTVSDLEQELAQEMAPAGWAEDP